MDAAEANTPEESNEAATKAAVFAAAERLFALHGFQNVSVRDITADAGVNLASVNYHFGSKDALLFEIFRRRTAELNRERARMLHEANDRHQGQPPQERLGPAAPLGEEPMGEVENRPGLLRRGGRRGRERRRSRLRELRRRSRGAFAGHRRAGSGFRGGVWRIRRGQTLRHDPRRGKIFRDIPAPNQWFAGTGRPLNGRRL